MEAGPNGAFSVIAHSTVQPKFGPELVLGNAIIQYHKIMVKTAPAQNQHKILLFALLVSTIHLIATVIVSGF